jgi:hypothetical protein
LQIGLDDLPDFLFVLDDQDLVHCITPWK